MIKPGTIEDLVVESEKLAKNGVKELILIAQDLTYYGLDIYKKRRLADLLLALKDIEGIEWIRLHYAFPTGFPLDVLDVIRNEKKVCNYIDIPLQHISDPVLKAMKRGTTFKQFNAEQEKPISRKTWNNMLNKIDYLTQNTNSTLTESEGDEHHLEKRWTLTGNPFLIIDGVNQAEITELKIASKTGGFENKKIIKQLAQKLESQATKTKTNMQDDIQEYLKSRGIMNQVSVQANENPEIKHKIFVRRRRRR